MHSRQYVLYYLLIASLWSAVLYHAFWQAKRWCCVLLVCSQAPKHSTPALLRIIVFATVSILIVQMKYIIYIPRKFDPAETAKEDDTRGSTWQHMKSLILVLACTTSKTLVSSYISCCSLLH